MVEINTLPNMVTPTKEDQGRWDQILADYAKRNAGLINDIPARAMQQIQDETMDALLTGEATDDLTGKIADILDEIEHAGSVTDSRAKLIARDQRWPQTNGQFTAERQPILRVRKLYLANGW